jgi:hypothetical protein
MKIVPRQTTGIGQGFDLKAVGIRFTVGLESLGRKFLPELIDDLLANLSRELSQIASVSNDFSQWGSPLAQNRYDTLACFNRVFVCSSSASVRLEIMVLASFHSKGIACGTEHCLWERHMRNYASICVHTRRGKGFEGYFGSRERLSSTP